MTSDGKNRTDRSPRRTARRCPRETSCSRNLSVVLTSSASSFFVHGRWYGQSPKWTDSSGFGGDWNNFLGIPRVYTTRIRAVLCRHSGEICRHSGKKCGHSNGFCGHSGGFCGHSGKSIPKTCQRLFLRVAEDFFARALLFRVRFPDFLPA